eukprot:gene31361-24912_t
MAPEAAKGTATAASDVWGVGIAFCEMLTGQVPYTFTEGAPYNPFSFVYKLKQGDALLILQLPTGRA